MPRLRPATRAPRPTPAHTRLNQQLDVNKYTGTVISGRGVMAKKMATGTQSQRLFDEATGTALTPGTLNIQLPGPIPFPPGCRRITRGNGKTPSQDIVNLIPARINGTAAWAIRHTAVEEHGDTSMIEIIAEHPLRHHLEISDGDHVTIEF